LADVCLKLDENTQAISICSKLLESEPQAPIKQKTLELLATAYTREKKYDKAVLALLGQRSKDDVQ
jgi:outer membrane protein assembly factor BamD (BamD/ComL family)